MPGVGVLELLAILAIAAIWLAIPIALIVLIRRRASATARTAAVDPALDALRSRLATGEIDEAEYLRLHSVLRGG
jgi:uncharacterized membrane protein